MIKVLDNFFDKNLLNKIQNHITTKIYYSPKWFVGQEKTNENYYGDRFLLSNDTELRDIFIKQAENKFKIRSEKHTSELQ